MARQPKGSSNWTKKEDALIISRYKELGPSKVQKLMPHRLTKAISNRARDLGVISERNLRGVSRIGTDPVEERDIIVGELRFLIHSICQDPDKREKSLMLLNMLAERNSAEWWSERRNEKLGLLCEKFIKGYVWVPIVFKRDDFLDQEGRFSSSTFSGAYTQHRP